MVAMSAERVFGRNALRQLKQARPQYVVEPAGEVLDRTVQASGVLYPMPITWSRSSSSSTHWNPRNCDRSSFHSSKATLLCRANSGQEPSSLNSLSRATRSGRSSSVNARGSAMGAAAYPCARSDDVWAAARAVCTGRSGGRQTLGRAELDVLAGARQGNEVHHAAACGKPADRCLGRGRHVESGLQ
jgi:hypothetical protein